MTDAAEDASTRFYRRPAFWLVVATLVYLAIILLIVAKRAQCYGGNVPIFFEALLGLHHHYLACRPLNELGDFLAGVFAPLALIWLAAAVFIQSRELAAQRQELALARDEARQTREVLQQQTEESRAATAFIGKQTEILENQQAQRAQAEIDEEFDEMVEAFLNAASGGEGVRLRCVVGNPGPRTHALPLVEPPNGRTPSQIFGALLENARTASSFLRLEEQLDISLNDADRGLPKLLVREIDRLLAIAPQLSQPHQVKARSYLLAFVKRALTELQEVVSGLPLKPQKPE